MDSLRPQGNILVIHENFEGPTPIIGKFVIHHIKELFMRSRGSPSHQAASDAKTRNGESDLFIILHHIVIIHPVWLPRVFFVGRLRASRIVTTPRSFRFLGRFRQETGIEIPPILRFRSSASTASSLFPLRRCADAYIDLCAASWVQLRVRKNE